MNATKRDTMLALYHFGESGYVFGGDLAWQAEGLCVTRTVDAHQADSFFPTGRPLKTAKAMCGACPVAEECLAYALRVGVEGIWGGTTTEEREDMREKAS